MGPKEDIKIFSPEDLILENERITKDAIEKGLHYDPSPRSSEHFEYAEEMFRQFPTDEEFVVQVAYLLKNMICAQRFKFGNKRTAATMVREFIRVNGYSFSASKEEWIRVCKKIQQEVPPAYIIWYPGLSQSDDFLQFVRGTGGGYAVKLQNIPMKADHQGSGWYNPWLINWVRTHLSEN